MHAEIGIRCRVMYKDRVIVLLVCTLVLVLGANAQRNNDVKGAHSWKTTENKQIATDMAHWSLLFNVGFNSFDGDFGKEMKHPVFAPATGLSVEYAFNPFLALGVDYVFDMYRVTGNPESDKNADILLQGMLHRAGGYIAVDLMNCFYPRAERKIFGFQLLGGGGAGWFKNSIQFTDDTRGNTANVEAKSMDKYQNRPYLMGGVNFEFNLSRGVALGIKGMYSYFTKDDIDGRGYQGLSAVASKNNDGIFDVTLNLRYKIDAVHKTHVRNMSSERIIDRQLAATESPKHPNVQTKTVVRVDTVVVVHKDTVVVQAAPKFMEETAEDYYFVYFETGKSSLSAEGLITVQQVATRMGHEPQRYAVVAGYCDNTGSESINSILGEARAESVMNELIEEYGIDAERITACGRGKIIGKRSKAAYSPNRRAEVRLVTRAEFEQLKAECAHGYKHPESARPAKTVSSAATTTVKHGNVSTATDNIIDEVVVAKNMTLSQLARKYYQNTHCWVYIYQANKQVIPNPNTLTTGKHLVIPELTEEQRNITKDQCLDMYKSLRVEK